LLLLYWKQLRLRLVLLLLLLLLLLLCKRCLVNPLYWWGCQLRV
jgi:hypothetical protein